MRHVRIPRQDIPVDLFKAAWLDLIELRIEVVQVRQQIPQRVPDLPVRFDRA